MPKSDIAKMVGVALAIILVFVLVGAYFRAWSLPGRDPCIMLAEQCAALNRSDIGSEQGKMCWGARLAIGMYRNRVPSDRCMSYLRDYNMWGL